MTSSKVLKHFGGLYNGGPDPQSLLASGEISVVLDLHRANKVSPELNMTTLLQQVIERVG